MNVNNYSRNLKTSPEDVSSDIGYHFIMSNLVEEWIIWNMILTSCDYEKIPKTETPSTFIHWYLFHVVVTKPIDLNQLKQLWYAAIHKIAIERKR